MISPTDRFRNRWKASRGRPVLFEISALWRTWLIGLVVVAALLVAACFGSQSRSPVLLPINKAALQHAVETTARDLLVPGAVVILRTPIGDFSTTYGTTTFGGTTPVSFDQHLRVGSNTKTWTGTVILQQVQEGLLSLDDPVSKFRSDVPNGNNITITQLLNMRSGLFNYSETVELNQILDSQPLKVWTQDELLALAFKNPPYFPPGADFHYSNTNTVLLGLIAEQLDGGKPLAKVFQDRLLTPLGLKGHGVPRHHIERHPRPASTGLHVWHQRRDDGVAPGVTPRHAGGRQGGNLGAQ